MKNLNYGFVGFGLIGGSIARNLRYLCPTSKIIAYNYNPANTNPNLLLAKEEGTLSKIVTSFEDGFPECDVIFLCAPVLRNISYLSSLKKVIKKSCIITDVGSVKSSIHDAVHEEGLDANFIGGHPMAGSEKTGYENSTRQLLENAYYVLTPTEQTPNSHIEIMEHLVSEIGAIPVILDPHNHDDIVAAISHVPHIIAASLVNMVKDTDDEQSHMHSLAAGGFKDITRIASSSPVMWENICLTNDSSITRFIDTYISYLTQMKQAIEEKDSEYLINFFQYRKDYRDTIPNKAVGVISSVYDLHIDVDDKKGAIATIATILASHDINMKNIRILHNREDIGGALCIDFNDEVSRNRAYQVLSSYNYRIHDIEDQ